MRRALFLALFAAVLAAGVCFAQTKKASQIPSPPPGRSCRLLRWPVRMRPPVPAHPNPYNVYGAQYPRIEADNRVTFHFTAPNAQKVQVALVTSGQGSLNPLPYDMVKGADGVWTYTSVPQGPGYHNYWMLVDGAIVLDPATRAFMGYSHMCNGFEIPEAGVDWYDLKDVPHGDVAGQELLRQDDPMPGAAFSSIRRRGMTRPTSRPVIRWCICSTAAAKMKAFGLRWAAPT